MRPHCLFLLALLVSACGDSTGPPTAAFLSLGEPPEVVVVGDTVRLRAAAVDASGRPLDAPVRWESRTPGIALVDSAGLVHALAAGAAVIRVSTRSDTAHFAFVVEAERVMAVVAALGQHSCALLLSGRASCWGHGVVGQLGTGDRKDVRVPGPVVTRERFSSISAGLEHTCALTRDGRAICWGNNTMGELGDGTREVRLLPTLVAGGLRFREISAGGIHTCGLTLDRETYCWGSYGADNRLNTAVPVLLEGGLKFESITAGRFHTCGLTADQRAYCWGAGALGRESTCSNGRQCSDVPVPVLGDLRFRSLSAGGWRGGMWAAPEETYTCGVLATRELLCWYGPPDPAARLSSIDFDRVSTGGVHACALKQSGEAYCWGNNVYGGIGAGFTSPEEAVPVAVAGGLRFEQINGGFAHTCALTAADAVYCWGYNSHGQIGTGSSAFHTDAPRQVLGLE